MRTKLVAFRKTPPILSLCMEGKCVVRTWILSIIRNSEVSATERFESMLVSICALQGEKFPATVNSPISPGGRGVGNGALL